MLRSELKADDVVGFTCGAFDLLHPGHLHYLLECAKRCDYLVIGLHTDPSIDRPGSKNRPAQTVFERWYQLAVLMINIDGDIVPYETERDLENMLGALPRLDVRFLGSDYIDKPFTGKQLCEDRGIRVEYVMRAHSWSSSELRSRLRT